MLNERIICVEERGVREREREREDCVDERERDGCGEEGVREMGDWDKRVG